jgi:hypothetical protein
LNARVESLGVHCQGCPDPGARAAVVVGRTCAFIVDGINAAIAIVDLMTLCILLRMLISSEWERRVFSTHPANRPHKVLDKRKRKKLAFCLRGTDVVIAL